MRPQKREGILLAAQELTVGYRTPLIEGIALQVRPGEIVALVGPNGAGKSTILKTLASQLKGLGGSVLLDGRETEAIPAGEKAKRLALLLTQPVRPDRMTCREVVETGRYPYTGYFGTLSSRDRATAEEAIALVEAGDFAERAFTQVSDGQRQRVLLARALCQEPGALLLDEPTAFLDIYHKAVFLELLRGMADRKGLGVVVTMHEPELAARAADWAVCIKAGELYCQGPAQEVLTPEGIRGLFDMPEAMYEKYFG